MFSLDNRVVPIIAAPMAGGPSTPDLVVAVSEAGGSGFLAAGYKAVPSVADEIEQVRSRTTSPFGVNLFVPADDPASDRDRATRVEAYRRVLREEADRYGCQVAVPDPLDRDGWDEKIALLLEDPVPMVSFTFGCPDRETIAALQSVGSYVVVTVTDAAEASVAAGRGANALCVQGPKAGGHRSTHDLLKEPGTQRLEDLLRDVSDVTDLPLIAAGGITRPEHIDAALTAGAEAVQIGTVLLRTPESGASALHKDALASADYEETRVTRAFSGRYARGLLNRFLREYHDAAPAAYPEVNQMSRPLRIAAAAAGDPDGMALLAGTGFRDAIEAPAAEIVTALWEATSHHRS